MPTYTYKAKDQLGGTTTGSVEASDSKAAAGMVREMGYWPLEIRQEGARRSTNKVDRRLVVSTNPVWTGVSTRTLAVFFRQLATMLHAGMSLGESLDSLGRQSHLKALAVISARGADHVRMGEFFSDVMSANPRIFSEAQIGLFRAGETGGMLDTMVDRIAGYLDRELEIRQKFARATFYPKLLIGFIALFLQFFPHLPAIVSRGLPVIYQALTHSTLPLVLMLVGVYVVAKLLLTLKNVRFAWDGFKLGFPVLGAVTRKLAMARMGTSMSVMFSAGVPISETIEVAANASGNEVIRRAVMRAIPQVQRGIPITQAFKEAGQMPEMVLSMLSTGERTGDIGSSLDKVSEYYEDEAVTTLEKTAHVLFAVMILVLGICVGKIVIGFMSGYYGGILSGGGVQ